MTMTGSSRSQQKGHSMSAGRSSSRPTSEGARRAALRRACMALALLLATACSREPHDFTAHIGELLYAEAAGTALAVLDRHLAASPHDTAARLIKTRLLVEIRAVDEALREYHDLV